MGVMRGRQKKLRLRATGPTQVSSIRALARLLRKGESTVRKWTRDRRWPFGRYGPWALDQVPLISAWQKMYLKHNAAEGVQRMMAANWNTDRPLSRTETAKLAYMTVRARLLAVRLELEEGKLHNQRECDERRLRQIHEVNSRLLELPRSLANSLAMQSAETVERLLAEHISAALDELRGSDRDGISNEKVS